MSTSSKVGIPIGLGWKMKSSSWPLVARDLWRTRHESPIALVYWLEKEYGIPRYNAYMLLSQCGIVRLGNVVDPTYSVGTGIKKTYFGETDALARKNHSPRELTRPLRTERLIP
jgi:acetamidase/formamidase